MKKFLAIILLISNICYGALSSGTLWESRTSGASTNGGGWNDTGGTSEDLTEQDAAAVSFTDLATSGIGVTTLTSATGGFDENSGDDGNIVGNIIQIASGTNVVAGFYEITAYTDDNTVTLDRAPDDGVGGIASGVGAVGGGLDHPERISSTYVAGNKIYIKSGTYQAINSNDFILSPQSSGASSFNSVDYIGYDTSRSVIPTGSNKPLLDGNSSETNCLVNSKYGIRFFNIRVTDSTSNGFDGNHTVANSYFNCKAYLCGGNGFDGQMKLYYCESSGNTGDGASKCRMQSFGYYHGNGDDGSYIESGDGGWVNCISEGNTDDGFSSFTSNGCAIGCIAYDNGDEGFTFCRNYGYHNVGVFNCSAYDNTGTGFDSLVNTYFSNNHYSNNGTALSGITSLGGDVTAAPQYTDAASSDFTLQSGSPLINAGQDLSTYTSITQDYNINIGIAQDDGTASGGGETSYAY